MVFVNGVKVVFRVLNVVRSFGRAVVVMLVVIKVIKSAVVKSSVWLVTLKHIFRHLIKLKFSEGLVRSVATVEIVSSDIRGSSGIGVTFGLNLRRSSD